MLSTNLFITQIFLQAKNYFNHNSFVKAEERNSEVRLNPKERTDLILSGSVAHVFYEDWENRDIFFDLDNQAPICMASFDKRLVNIDSLKTKLKRATLKIRIKYIGKDHKLKNLETIIENNQLIFNERSQHLNFLLISISKSEHKKILELIKKNKLSIKMTEVSLRFSESENILLCQIVPTDEDNNLHIYWPKKDLDEIMIEDLLPKNSKSNLQHQKGIFMRIIELLKKEINGTNPKMSSFEDKLRLHYDELPSLLLYYTPMTFYFNLFAEINIKLLPFDKQDSEKKEIDFFGYNPSVMIEFSRKNNSNFNKINLQITENEYNSKSKQYSFDKKKSSISFKNIDFSNATITSEQEGIVLYTTIRRSKNNPNINMYLHKKELLFQEEEVYDSFKDSTVKIIINTYGKKEKNIVFDSNSFEITNNQDKFEINLNFADNKQDGISLLDSLVNEGNVFNILVKDKNETIIESIVYFDKNKMVVMSSNKILDILKTLKSKNDALIASSQSITPPTNPPPSPPTNPSPIPSNTGGNSDSTQQGPISPVNKPVSTDSNKPPGGVPAGSNPGGVPDGNSTGNKSGESGSNKNKLDDGLVKHVSAINDSISASKKGNQNVKNTGPKKKQLSSSQDGKGGNTTNTGGSQEQDDTNPTTEVPGTTTTDDSTKSATKSETEKEKEKEESEDTPEKEESESGNSTIIIIAAIVGVLVIGALISYMVFF